MKKGVLYLGLLAGLVLAPALASSKLEPPELDRYMRWGPLRVRPGFTISNLGYDDNIFYRSDDKVGDFTATLSPKLDGLVLFGDRAFLTFREQFDYTLYLDNEDQNYTNNRASARFTLPLGNFGFFANAALNDVKYRPLDRDDIRPERRESRLGAGVIARPGWRTEIEIGHSISDYSHSDPGAGNDTLDERLDRRETTSMMEVSYRLQGRTDLLLRGLTRDIEFDYLYTLVDPPVDRATDEWRMLGGFRFGEGGILTGTLLVGHARIDAVDTTLPDLSEIIGEAELIYRLSGSTKILLEGERLPGFAVYDVNTYYLNSAIEARVVHYLNRLFGLEAGARAGRLTFPEQTGVLAREDDIRRYEAGVRFRLFENSIGRRIEYSFKIGRFRRESTDDNYDQSRTTYSFGAVVGF
jgi:hypothetical protein